MGCEEHVLIQRGMVRKTEALENIGVVAACDPGFERGWEAGSLYRSFQKPQQRRTLSAQLA